MSAGLPVPPLELVGATHSYQHEKDDGNFALGPINLQFEPGVGFPQRLFDAYAYEVALVDSNSDGVISAAEGDADTSSDGFADNSRLFIPATLFKRFAGIDEDGMW